MIPIDVVIGALLTILVLSYLVGDNPLYRLAMHVLVGVGATYAVGVAISQVLVPRVFAPLDSLGRIPALSDAEKFELAFALFGLLGLVFLLAKSMRRAAWLGNAAVGYMLGAGVGVAVGGALLGTLVPQTLDATLSFNSTGPDFIGGLLLLLSTVATLLAFSYRRAVRRSAASLIALVGRGFLYVAFGATFALVFISGASVLGAWMRGLYVFLDTLLRGNGIG